MPILFRVPTLQQSNIYHTYLHQKRWQSASEVYIASMVALSQCRYKEDRLYLQASACVILVAIVGSIQVPNVLVAIAIPAGAGHLMSTCRYPCYGLSFCTLWQC